MSILDGDETLPEAAESLEEGSIISRAVEQATRYFDTSDPYVGKKAVAATTAAGGAAIFLTSSAGAGALALSMAGAADYLGDDYTATNRLVDNLKEAPGEFREGYLEGRYGQE
ncbi:MAG: hypothetical protein ABEI58_01640 [Candidatus Nanohaloarchaea archaeon]